MTEHLVARRAVTLDGQRISYLYGGEGSPVLLLHGTFWSHVWSPIIPKLDEDKEIERYRKAANRGHAVLPLVFATPRTGAPG